VSAWTDNKGRLKLAAREPMIYSVRITDSGYQYCQFFCYVITKRSTRSILRHLNVTIKLIFFLASDTEQLKHHAFIGGIL